MKSTLSFLSFFCCLLLLNAQRYQISGTVDGMSDGSWLLLSDVTAGQYQRIDSAQVRDGNFSFSGPMALNPVHLAVHTQDFRNRATFWAEDKPIQLRLNIGHFNQIIVTGSATDAMNRQLQAQLENSTDEVQQLTRFITKNPGSVLSAFQLKGLAGQLLSPAQAEKYYKLLAPEVQKSYYGQQVADFIRYTGEAKIGDRYIDFQANNLEGVPVRVSDYNGKVLLLDFWGSWCESCLETFPALVKVHQQFHAKGFDILGIVVDYKKPTVEKMVQQYKIPWQNVSSFKGTQEPAALMYNVHAFPTNILIDRHGIIVARDVEIDELPEKISDLLENSL